MSSRRCPAAFCDAAPCFLDGEPPLFRAPHSTPRCSRPPAHGQRRFPVLPRDRDAEDTFSGAKRGFMAAHIRACAFASRVGDSAWRTERQAHDRAYRREFATLMARRQAHDDETLRRANRRRPKSSEAFVGPTTGPRPLKALPPEVQDTTHARYHRLYFGA
jgi:hypothetical protein